MALALQVLQPITMQFSLIMSTINLHIWCCYYVHQTLTCWIWPARPFHLASKTYANNWQEQPKTIVFCHTTLFID